MKFPFALRAAKGPEPSRSPQTETLGPFSNQTDRARSPARDRSGFPGVRSQRTALLATLLAVLLVGCKEDAPPAPQPEASAPKTQGDAKEKSSSSSSTEVRRSLLDFSESCALGQRGLVLDLGDKTAQARRMFRLNLTEPVELTSRLGESFRVLDQTSTDFVFWLTEEMKDFVFTARVHGQTSERLAAHLDGQRLGAAKLSPEKTRVITISTHGKVLAPGRHTLTLGISRPRHQEPRAEVSWVRLGPPLAGEDQTDVPATRKEVFSEVTIEKQRLRSIVLRPSGSLRCPVWVPENSRLLAQVGIWGEGEGELEIVAHTRDGRRTILADVLRKEDEPRDFAPVVADLSRFASQFIDLEISAPRSLKRARLAVGEPILESKTEKRESSPKARRAIVMVLSGLGQRHAPPLAAENGLPIFNHLAQHGVYFPGYRASSTSVPGVIASILTGLPPWLHHVGETDTALSPDIVTLASAVEGTGGHSAFFSAVPFSFSPFGFNRGFGHFEFTAPQEDRAATEPLEMAKKWLSKHLQQEDAALLVMHLRGGHPPFDVPKEASLELPPTEYGGNLSARRAAIQLAEVRDRTSEQRRQMPDEDWTRLFALQKAALLRQNAEITALLDWLRRQDAYQDTLIVVVGDVGAGEVPAIPFADRAPLDEAYLTPPLIIKFPSGYGAGKEIFGAFAPHDLTRTVADALGVSFSAAKDAIDLGSSDAARLALLRPHIAFRGMSYSLRQGNILLRGEDGTAPKLCLPALDPNCLVDRSEERVLQARALWFELFHVLSPPLSKPHKEEPVELEPEHENALTVWGIHP